MTKPEGVSQSPDVRAISTDMGNMFNQALADKRAHLLAPGYVMIGANDDFTAGYALGSDRVVITDLGIIPADAISGVPGIKHEVHQVVIDVGKGIVQYSRVVLGMHDVERIVEVVDRVTKEKREEPKIVKERGILESTGILEGNDALDGVALMKTIIANRPAPHVVKPEHHGVHLHMPHPHAPHS